MTKITSYQTGEYKIKRAIIKLGLDKDAVNRASVYKGRPFCGALTGWHIHFYGNTHYYLGRTLQNALTFIVSEDCPLLGVFN